MENLDIQKLVEISKMYYNEHMTQEVISKYFSISRSAVSLCLAEAKNVGIVQIQINDPSENNETLARQMEETFGLKKCIAVPSGTYREDVLVHMVVSQAVRYAIPLMKSHSCVGTSWGGACYEFMQHFPVHLFSRICGQFRGPGTHYQKRLHAADLPTLARCGLCDRRHRKRTAAQRNASVFVQRRKPDAGDP